MSTKIRPGTRHITKLDLLALLRDVPNNAILVVPAPDHSYRPAVIEADTTVLYDGTYMTEDHGEEITPESEYGKRVPAILIT